MKDLRRKIYTLTLSLCLPLGVRAANWYLPGSLQIDVQIFNRKNMDQTAWWLVPHAGDAQSLHLHALEKLHLTLNSPSWVQVKGEDLEVSLSGQNMPAGRHSQWQLMSKDEVLNTEIELINLSPIDQDGLILFSSAQGDRSLHLPKFSRQRISVSLGRGESLRLSFQFPIIAWQPNNHRMLSPLLNQLPQKKKRARFRFSSATESFMIETDDLEFIQQARTQLSGQQEKKILSAQIQISTRPINFDSRNVAWSWETSEIFGFVELASQDCDGGPQYIEDILPLLAQPKLICFWNYKISSED